MQNSNISAPFTGTGANSQYYQQFLEQSVDKESNFHPSGDAMARTINNDKNMSANKVQSQQRGGKFVLAKSSKG